MRKLKKQLVLIVATFEEPLKARVVYTGRTPAHKRPPVMQRVLHFRLGELTKPTRRLVEANLARTPHIAGPWDVSAANEVRMREHCFPVERFVGGSSGVERKLIIGTKRVAEFFGPKRRKLFDECMDAFDRPDLVGIIPEPKKGSA